MLAKERAKIWATDPHFDEKTREAAAQMLENEEELLSAFGTELAFGTGGLRGVLGIGTDRMNEYTVGRATQGLADYLNVDRSALSKELGKMRDEGILTTRKNAFTLYGLSHEPLLYVSFSKAFH